jgi:3-methylcrotonyl-CoA carboxylase alpha subunit
MRFTYRRSLEDEQTITVDIVPLEGSHDTYRVTVGSRVFELPASLLHRLAFLKHAGEITMQYEGKEYRLFDAAQRQHVRRQHAGDLHAPMAGKVIRILVQPGERVSAGTTLLLLEAMKMEQPVVAPRDGVIADVLCHEGEQVTAGAELVRLAPQDVSG